MKLLSYGWNVVARAYYARALRSLARQRRTFTQDWVEVFWLHRRAQDNVKRSFK